ncbi:ABC transporter permease [Cytobacillus praedii]|uniref:ABC transporter permease n=1 Tax=Cytobacillus praedii TaxID=1742358 RepID=A0A4R1AYZ4_9BACI|nr:ABC transporter permease [Cytobacillus praedii]MED3552856.1 ABC transporter permease [Cytobacillus praedii]MED3574055.1 ABC transporter permease [Cytobacillus praedii]TCJ03234.1 ABC transporter permease [Cytobacillus praedii]
MIFSVKRTMAIFQKDYKDILKNYFVSSSVLMPLVLAALYGRMGVETVNEHYLIFNMTFCLVAAYVQCSLIAEEKEKNTLRGLMLSPASTLEILGGKSLLSFIGTILVIVISAFLTEYKPENILVISIAIVLSTVFYIGLGTVLGLMTKSVMEASVVILPFIGIFSFGSMLTYFADKFPILKAAEYMPNSQLINLANQVQTGAGLLDVWFNFAIILAWVAVIYVIVVIVYRKRMMD